MNNNMSIYVCIFTVIKVLSSCVNFVNCNGSRTKQRILPLPGRWEHCLCYCFSQKSAHTFRVNEIRLGADRYEDKYIYLSVDQDPDQLRLGQTEGRPASLRGRAPNHHLSYFCSFSSTRAIVDIVLCKIVCDPFGLIS